MHMTETFRPTLLLSMPQMRDPNFSQTVVLLCDYVRDGAFGIVLNRPTDNHASTMVNLDPPITRGSDLPLFIGGPVQPDRGFILLDSPPETADFRIVVDGLYLSTSAVTLRRVLEARPAPRARVLAGYAGWGPGQLEDELAQSSWLMADVDVSLVFDVEASRMWETALRRLGADPAALQTSPGIH
ncbi:MAG: YqgE/AlgH family protein [Vicinamibacterales bacterium]